MSRITYGSKGKSPFEDEDDNPWGGGHGNSRGRDPFADEDDSWDSKPMSATESRQMQIDQSINNQLASTQRALGSIFDSEQTGIATAEELVRQGEQLDNVECKTHQINQEMKSTQKSLNGIKSVFGSMKNWWGGKKDEPKEEFIPPPRESHLKETLDTQRANEVHPSLRMRSEDFQGFYEDSEGASSGRGTNSSYSTSSSYSTQRTTTSNSSRMAAYEDQVDQNLGMMSDGLSRLKMLGRGLEQEITEQNEQLERITPQIDKASGTIQDQTGQMRKILGKKK